MNQIVVKTFVFFNQIITVTIMIKVSNEESRQDLLRLTMMPWCICTVGFSSRTNSVCQQLSLHYCLDVNDFKLSRAHHQTIKIPWETEKQKVLKCIFAS